MTILIRYTSIHIAISKCPIHHIDIILMKFSHMQIKVGLQYVKIQKKLEAFFISLTIFASYAVKSFIFMGANFCE